MTAGAVPPEFQRGYPGPSGHPNPVRGGGPVGGFPMQQSYGYPQPAYPQAYIRPAQAGNADHIGGPEMTGVML